jgi:proton-dependent oligopeptide transporter, POT family
MHFGIVGHPKGLSVLFFTELWERFSYYGMRAILILFLTSSVGNHGLGLSTADAAGIYGWYTMLVYMAAIPGGWLADRHIGMRRAVLFGGVLIALGNFALAVTSPIMVYLGLGLIVLGTGLLKPNVSCMVGELYSAADHRRDSGFIIFYMGINLGATIAPLVCGWFGQRVNWHWGFLASGIGMSFGLLQYLLGWKWLGTVGLGHEKRNLQRKEKAPFTKEEKNRIGAILALFIFTTLFWAAYEQAGSSLNLFAQRFTRTSLFGWEFPSSWLQSVNPALIFVFAPVLAWLWVRLGRFNPSSPAKFAYGLLFVGFGFVIMMFAAMLSGVAGEKVSPMFLVGCFFMHTVGELVLSPVGLSTVTKLAPARIGGLMMGVWFLSLSLGNKLGGWVAGFFDTFPLPKLFGAVSLTTIAAGVALALLVRPIRRLMSGVH